jgi:hypothetical protein
MYLLSFSCKFNSNFVFASGIDYGNLVVGNAEAMLVFYLKFKISVVENVGAPVPSFR